MSTLSKIYQDVSAQDISLFLYPIGFADAASIRLNDQYAIFLDFSKFPTLRAYTEALAHECGHCATGAMHTVSSPYDLIEKHEFKADRWAFERYLPFDALCDAMRHGCTGTWQLAEVFGFPEDFIRKAIRYYVQNKGLSFNAFSTFYAV